MLMTDVSNNRILKQQYELIPTPNKRKIIITIWKGTQKLNIILYNCRSKRYK